MSPETPQIQSRAVSAQTSHGKGRSLQCEWSFAGWENQPEAGKDEGGWGKGRHQRVGAGRLAWAVKELGCREKLIDRVSWWQQQGLPGPRSLQLAQQPWVLLVSLSGGIFAHARMSGGAALTGSGHAVGPVCALV